jgi:hypothetical protein
MLMPRRGGGEARSGGSAVCDQNCDPADRTVPSESDSAIRMGNQVSLAKRSQWCIQQCNTGAASREVVNPILLVVVVVMMVVMVFLDDSGRRRCAVKTDE